MDHFSIGTFRFEQVRKLTIRGGYFAVVSGYQSKGPISDRPERVDLHVAFRGFASGHFEDGIVHGAFGERRVMRQRSRVAEECGAALNLDNYFAAATCVGGVVGTVVVSVAIRSAAGVSQTATSPFQAPPTTFTPALPKQAWNPQSGNAP